MVLHGNFFYLVSDGCLIFPMGAWVRTGTSLRSPLRLVRCALLVHHAYTLCSRPTQRLQPGSPLGQADGSLLLPSED